MGHPVRGAHKRRAVPCHRVGQPHPVGGPAECDVLSRRRRFLRWLRRDRGSSRVVDDRPDELVSAAAHRPDVALRFAVVAQCPPRRLYPASQGRLTHELSAPYRVEQLFFCDAALVVAHQLGQDVEHLRLDAHHRISVTEFVALGVEDELIEAPQAGVPYRQPSAALAARIRASHISRNSVVSAPSSIAVATSSAAHLTW